MIILGLGSNLGHRLNQLREAIAYLKQHPHIQVIQCSPIYQSRAQLTPGAPQDWGKPFLNMAVQIETSLTPVECLDACKAIEQKMDREDFGRWAPRTIDIDILDWNEQTIQNVQLHTPHPRLGERPFALFPLLDLHPFWQHPEKTKQSLIQEMLSIWGSRFDGKTPFETRQIHQRAEGPRLVGILNVTPDSFADGNKFLDPSKALRQVEYLLNSGAEIIDIGAESTRPGATPITAAEEWKRLEPVLKFMQRIACNFLDRPTICVDTRHAKTAEKALGAGATWLNDVSGLKDPAYIQLVRDSGCRAVFMHHLTIPADKTKTLSHKQPLVNQVKEWIMERLETLMKAGVAPEQLIADVGIGFGKSAAQDMFLLQNIQSFKDLPVPLLVGHSCKYFLGQLLTGSAASDRHLETSIISTFLAQAGVDYIRVHDPLWTARAIKVAHTMQHPYVAAKVQPTKKKQKALS